MQKQFRVQKNCEISPKSYEILEKSREIFEKSYEFIAQKLDLFLRSGEKAEQEYGESYLEDESKESHESNLDENTCMCHARAYA